MSGYVYYNGCSINLLAICLMVISQISLFSHHQNQQSPAYFSLPISFIYSL